MSEFQLYKKREFSDFIGDTLQFFKKYWKNYLQNYFLTNGIVLLAFAGVYYLTFKDMFANMSNPQGMQQWSQSLINNPAAMVGMMGIMFLLSIVLGVLSTAYPMVYLQLLATEGDGEFSVSLIWKEIMNKAVRILLFGLISIFVLFPAMMIVLVVGVALSFILIGIPLLILSLPAMMILSFQALYLFVVENEGYFRSLKKAWKITFDKFWHLVGATVVLYFCISIFSSMFSVIPMFFAMGSVITSGGQHGIDPSFGGLMAIMYVLMIFVTCILYNAIYIQQGLIFYSSQEKEVNVQAFSDIDSIGRDEE